MTHEYRFTFTDRLVLSGLVVFEDIEIDGRALFTFRPGHPARGPSYASGGEPADDPEIEIDTLQVFGHAINGKTIATKPEYRDLAPSDERWRKIADWLLAERFSEMCDAVDDPRLDWADCARDQKRDEELMLKHLNAAE